MLVKLRLTAELANSIRSDYQQRQEAAERAFNQARDAYNWAISHVHAGVELDVDFIGGKAAIIERDESAEDNRPTNWRAYDSYAVPSRTRKNKGHEITRNFAAWSCNCEAGTNGRECWAVAAIKPKTQIGYQSVKSIHDGSKYVIVDTMLGKYRQEGFGLQDA